MLAAAHRALELLVQSTPDRLVLLPAVPDACPSGELRGIRTRFGAELDLTWDARHVTLTSYPNAKKVINRSITSLSS